MQAKLPDLNAAIVRHRNVALYAYDQGDFAKAGTSLDAINSILPEEYRLEINTEKYYEAIKGKEMIVCRYCERTTERQIIKPYTILLSSLDRLISGQKQMVVWSCLGCKKIQPLAGSPTKRLEWKQPFYTGYIPSPPKREGLHDRIGHTHRFREWFDIVFHELEAKIGEYRSDYARQQDEGVIIDDSQTKTEDEGAS